MRAAALACLLSLVSAATASPTTWYITPDGTGDAPTIQDAMNQASDGDEIVLGDGLFVGPGNRDVDFLRKAVLVRSESDNPLLCVMDVEGAPGNHHRGFIMTHSPGVSAGLRSITIRNGYMDGDSLVTSRGGAVFCPTEGTPFFENVRFEAHTSTLGGAVFVRGGHARVEDCEFVGNRSEYLIQNGHYLYGEGGAAFVWDATSSFSRCRFTGNESARRGGALGKDGVTNLTIADCVFEDNSADDEGGALDVGISTLIRDSVFRRNSVNESGGAIHGGRDVTIAGCTFSGNTAGRAGGALSWDANSHDIVITDSDFVDNEAARRGGAIEMWGSAAGPFTVAVESCRFRQNTAPGSVVPGRGGAIHLTYRISADVSGTTFHGNRAEASGGAVYGAWEVTFAIDGCTFVANSAPSGAGSFFYEPGSVVQRTIAAFNLQGAAFDGNAGAEPTVACSDIFGNEGGDGLFGIDGGGNFFADPLFCDRAGGDFTIQSDSPCAPPGVTGCGLVGALPVGCGPVALENRSWGAIKALYR